MSNPKLTFYIEEEVNDYCGMCQQLGPAQFGVKMHRNLPAQVFWVRASAEGLPKDKRYTKLCSDCLFEAHSSKEVEAIYKNDMHSEDPGDVLWDPYTSGMFFIRSNLKEKSSDGQKNTTE